MSHDLPVHVRALLDPSVYPGDVKSVELVETHISWVFLAGDRVYKLRRPVDFGFLDFTTLARRRVDCDSEVRLNRRLAPDVYLGVARITIDGGRFAINGPGCVVDYAVVMRRLSKEAFLDAMLRAGSATPVHVERVAEALAAFHASAPGGPSTARFGRPAVLRGNWRDNFEKWAPWLGSVLTPEEDAEIRSFVRRTIRELTPALLARIEDGRVREVHGDLRAVQIAFEGERPLILDCVEFSRRLRSIDCASDIAFLAMDLDAHGRHDYSRALLRRYVAASAEYATVPLLPLYLAYRAAVRAKVALLRSAQLEQTERRNAEAEARGYLELLLRYVRERRQPFLAITSGLSGTGKSTLAGELARRTGARVFASDPVRKKLVGVAARERAPEEAYSGQWTERTYAELCSHASRALRNGHDVILDATFLSPAQRQAARDAAVRAGARFACIETVLPRTEARRRLTRRAAAGASVSDATWEIYRRQQEVAMPPDEIDASERLTVRMDRSISENVSAALKLLLAPLL